MMNRIGKLLIWGMLLPLTVLNAYTLHGDSLNQKIYISDTILIASEPDYPPYCIVDEDGNASGFAVDLFMAAARAAGLDVKIKIGLWNKIKRDLAEGKIDALPFVGRTPEREMLFDFSLPYMSLHGAVFLRREQKNIQTLADLKNKVILVMKGDNAEEFVRRERVSDKIITTNTFEEAFRLLAAGEGDAVITQRLMGIQLLEKLDISSVYPLELQIPQFRQDFCFAVKKGNRELLSRLDEGLSLIISTDVYEQIRSKWFGPAFREKISWVEIAKYVVYILIPLLIIFSASAVFALRKEVRRKTGKLNQEIDKHKNTLESLKAKEEQIRLLLNSTAEGIYGTDRNGKCEFINHAAIRILGYERKEQFIAKDIHELIHHSKVNGSTCTKEECPVFETLETGEGTHTDDELLWRADGSSFPAEIFAYPIRRNDSLTGAVVTFWDISGRKERETDLQNLTNNLEAEVEQRTTELREKVNKLNRSKEAMLYMVEDLNQITAELKNEREKLERSNRELDAFTYSVSHDLRAPLRAINGFSKFLIEDYTDRLDPEGKRFLDTIRENAAKMDQLILDMLSLSRISRSELKMAPVDMEAIIRSMFHEIASEEEKKSFKMIIQRVPAVTGDSALLKQVWQNLIANALKYSSKSKLKKIEIGANIDDIYITYFIKDHGAGFDDKYKHKLFGVFQRLHREDEFKGTGVGLAIIKRIIDRHNGKVWAEGAPDKGATFYFSLPKTP